MFWLLGAAGFSRRAAGIRSRIKMGYVYASGMWGGHAWVEVLVGKDWIPIDAAAYSPGPADAARFSAFASWLEEGISTGIGALARLYGNVDIQILKYTLKGQLVTVPVGAPPYVTTDKTYRNQWLGLTVVKPDSFRFTRLDSVWPDHTIVAMERASIRRWKLKSFRTHLRLELNPRITCGKPGSQEFRKA